MKYFKSLIVATILVAATYIIVTDAGDAISHTSGAGDIWWMDTGDVNLAYRSIIEKQK